MATKLTESQTKILSAYCKYVEEKKQRPTRTDMAVLGYNRDQILRHFGSLQHLMEMAKRRFPEIMSQVVDETVFSKKKFEAIRKDSREYERFVITTVVAGCKVDTAFLDSLDTYCAHNDALLLLMTCADPARQVKEDSWDFDPVLKGRNFVGRDLAINQALWLSTIKLSAKHIDPVTSLDRLGQRNGSFVYASPKQRLKMVPTSNKKPPVAVMTTGALTTPDYYTTRYLSDRTAKIAGVDHVMGAIVVEVAGPRRFHFRQIQADGSGAFVDFGSRYDGEDITRVHPEAMVLGDYHCGETDPAVDACWKADAELLKPARIIFHDLFNGMSINYHDRFKKITLAQRAQAGLLNLRKEVDSVALALSSYAGLAKELVVVKSNHDEFLEKYLEDCAFKDQPENLIYGLELALELARGNDPLKYAVNQSSGLSSEANVRWLQRSQDFKLFGIELGAHGDKGANGAPGSLAAMEKAFGQSVSGHAHVDEIFRGCYQVGTSSILDPKYAKDSLSSWTQSRCDVYKGGHRQLIRVIDGETHLKG